MLMQMLATGAIGGAVASAMARALGAGDEAAAEGLIWHAILLALAGGLFFLLLNGLFGQELLVLLGGTAGVLADAHQYASIMFGGCAAIWLAAILSSLFRGMGDMKYPAVVMIAGALLQIPLSGRAGTGLV